MRVSNWFVSTLKETPNDAEIISHKLMLRAGMIRKLGSGLYTWLPVGLRVLRKVEKIVRQEMDNSGALEILMPAVQPAELWQETGRWETFGNQLLTMQDNNSRQYCFGPTHEEVITDLVRVELQSYKQLPINFYQIQTKFRDEIRPRFGVMRAREFLMKDAYSFHLTKDSLQETYDTMYRTYSRIFTKLGLKFRAVEADTGAIGGSFSHEFQLLAEAGEDVIFYSDTSAYAANVERATSLHPKITDEVSSNNMKIVETPNIKTIEQLSSKFNIQATESVKTLIVRGKNHDLIALILRGDDELNVIKAEKHPLVATPLCFVDEEEVKNQLKVSFGSIGPVNLNIPVIVDYNARALTEFVCGANKNDFHYFHVSWGRDAKYDEVYDLRNVKVGDLSPDGQGKLLSCRGIEAGHIFQLGYKYAKAMRAEVLDENGKLTPMLMGCYGIGISRIVAAAIEQSHDENGIIWPEAIAPFQLIIIPINYNRSEAVKNAADALYETLQKQGIEVLLDDRKERPGVMFADSDLLGIPHRIVISDKLLEQGIIEYKNRLEKEAVVTKLTNVSFSLIDSILNGRHSQCF
ncbi:MAG: proline--tRNA ligase [Legionellales bacterium RIFCSPHIGHO2_12_FULL_35_11]|nr:MAG: proline--tRNA ligase [Legionellales bacterium RIFCSPHIGHO2_12_FULL_35_11]